MKLQNLLSHLVMALALPLSLSAHATDAPKPSREDWDNTFSIVARDPATGAVGAAVSTARLAVGNRVLQVEFGVGAVASQANTNPMLAKDALDRLRQGATAKDALDAAFETTPGTLADRVMTALEAGQKAGGDRRGKISAAIVVLNEAPGTSGYARNIDLRIDSSKDPVGELRVLFDAYKAAFKIK